MARGINKVILVGTLGADPETRYPAGGGGATITSLRLATNESWTDKQGQKQERTEWHRVKFFGKLAEIASEYLRKGSQVYVEGSLRTDKYTDRDGNERYTTDIIANEMQMLGGRSEGGGGGGGPRQDRPPRSHDDDFETRGGAGYGAPRGGERPAPASRAAPPPLPASDIPFDNDDIPF